MENKFYFVIDTYFTGEGSFEGVGNLYMAEKKDDEYYITWYDGTKQESSICPESVVDHMTEKKLWVKMVRQEELESLKAEIYEKEETIRRLQDKLKGL